MIRCFVAVAACVVGLVFAAGANAAVTVGQLFTPTYRADCMAGTALQIDPGSGNGYSVPSAGVITSWSFNDGADTVPNLEFKVGRKVSGDDYTIVGTSVAGVQAPNTVVSFPARISVQAGDVIGLYAGGGTCGSDTTGTYEWVDGTNEPLGSTTTFRLIDDDFTFPVAAQVEPDADGDGFGDETQDLCPTEANTQAACPSSSPPSPRHTTPPSLSASSTKGAKLSRSGALSLAMTSSEPASGSATGTISLPSVAKTVRFKTAKVKLTPGKRTKISLKLSTSNAQKVRKALKHHKLKAKITVTVKDSAGNTTTKKLTIELKH